MKKYTYKKRVKIPIYVGSVEIVLTNTQTKLTEDCSIEDHQYGLELQTTDEDGKLMYIIAFNLHKKFNHGTISHECLHVVIDLFTYIKLQLSEDVNNGNEAYTYMLGWLVDEVYTFMKEKNIKIK